RGSAPGRGWLPPRPRAVRSRGTRGSTSPAAVPGPSAGVQPARPSTTDRSPARPRRWAGSAEARGAARSSLLLRGHRQHRRHRLEVPRRKLGATWDCGPAVTAASAPVAGEALPDDRLGGGRAGPVVVHLGALDGGDAVGAVLQ